MPKDERLGKREAELAIELLNEIHRLDPTVLQTLIVHRVECSQAFLDHDTVQVGHTEDGGYRVGLLGILNGIFGVSSGAPYGYIAACYDAEGSLLGFKLLEPKPWMYTS